ncbi:hypothetical protein INT46_008735 [Mucor plumbeus]|uniref:BZIP domain-containing protein n=1 Tax=Mucor plumbeus TaxID=97098 RepID=A0A8H7R0S4_9FUNG|nr:hypothetical protein INT46_008735 [Mucor plumbeus]
MSSSSPSSISASARQGDNIRQFNSRSRSPSPTKKTVIESRRAEQNRAAQRAFRQRKELYVKELEAKVNQMADWPARMEQLENENEQLKRKIAQLEHENDNNHQRKAIKLDYTSPSLSSLSSPNTKKSTTSESQQQQTEQKRSSQPKQAGEKGKVLDDLVSILKTRNRPPIQYHQYQPSK